jgi:hypothetical protein
MMTRTEVKRLRRTANEDLHHPAAPQRLILLIHGSTISGWIVSMIFKSAMVRTQSMKRNPFGAGLTLVLNAGPNRRTLLKAHWFATPLQEQMDERFPLRRGEIRVS